MMIKELNKSEYQLLGEKYHQDLVDNLKAFSSINSVHDESTKDSSNPFGKGVSKALKFVEGLARRDGFKVKNYDNMVVEIIAGEGEKNITIMGHADVVPAGNGWKQDPFTPVEKNGCLYGRGVSDDKGPVMASYYALKMLRDNNLLGNYHVRLLIGGNEESGSACMEHYFHDLKMYQPTIGFSPDADYPLIYAEKGIVNFEVKTQIRVPHLYSLKGGVAFNCVIEECDAILDLDEEFVSYLVKNDVKHRKLIEGNKMVITFLGKSAHGSTPQQGINSGMIALKAIGEFYGSNVFLDLYKKYIDVYGSGINAYNKTDDMGENSSNVGIINFDGVNFSMTVNFRHVNGVTPESLIERIKEANKDYQITVLSIAPLLYYPKDSPLVSTLLKVYQEETGDYKSEPLAIGGGTYAKDADNVVAFGMQFPGVDLKFHSPDEYVPLKDLYISLGIYAHAIVELGKIIS